MPVLPRVTERIATRRRPRASHQCALPPRSYAFLFRGDHERPEGLTGCEGKPIGLKSRADRSGIWLNRNELRYAGGSTESLHHPVNPILVSFASRHEKTATTGLCMFD
ncbi:Uncharacterized protein DAT39_011938 [Clarias magur]|uniref:Uncharacterized protein n=1 Tax=Clarias magur TaxID=1594786 RepID=A0A8J4UHY6_CLAMG|nr:Uncharacterized protein DAT39_011938 [Clarias magur]